MLKKVLFAFIIAAFFAAGCEPVSSGSAGSTTGNDELPDDDGSATEEEPLDEPVAVESVRLNRKTASILPGGTVTLTATVSPDYAKNKMVTWASDDESIAAVTTSDGRTAAVTGTAAGTATITVTAEDNRGKTAECVLTVKEADISFSITTPEQWNDAIATMSQADTGTAENPDVFVLSIEADIEAVPQTAGIGTSHKEVWLTGNKTISLDSEGGTGSLIHAAANQTFIIDGPALQGKMDNDIALVHINGGNVELLSGMIKGNRAPYGGGVRVASGTFTMEGGTISGNSAPYGGGGVYVNSSGTFEMKDGAISGNSGSPGGGGVYVNSNGSFTMEGGTINGNSTHYGGGVNVSRSGMFTMEGGTISGHSARYGGGVYIDGGMFTMSGGIIYGSNATGNDSSGKPLRNTVTEDGAAVYKNGNIKENTVTSYP
jgi:hypothetical protein